MSTILAPAGYATHSGFVSGGYSMAVPYTAGSVVGDLAVAVIRSRLLGGTTPLGWTLPSGWAFARIPTVVTGGHPTLPFTSWRRAQGIAFGPVTGTTPSFGFSGPNQNAAVSLLTIQGSDGILHNPVVSFRSQTSGAAVASLLTAPDPAPSAPATLLTFGMGVRYTGTDWTLLGEVREFQTEPGPGQPADMWLTGYMRNVTGGTATTMPSDTVKWGVWHSIWITPPALPPEPGGWHLGLSTGSGWG